MNVRINDYLNAFLLWQAFYMDALRIFVCWILLLNSVSLIVFNDVIYSAPKTTNGAYFKRLLKPISNKTWMFDSFMWSILRFDIRNAWKSFSRIINNIST